MLPGRGSVAQARVRGPAMAPLLPTSSESPLPNSTYCLPCRPRQGCLWLRLKVETDVKEGEKLSHQNWKAGIWKTSYSAFFHFESAKPPLLGYSTRVSTQFSTMRDEDVTSEALRLLNSCQQMPRLVVFDLDYTLWPFWCECRSKKEQPSLYPQAKGILNALREKGVSMAVASRTPTPDIATAFLKKLDLPALFADMQIYPSWTHKVEHFQKIQQKTGVPFSSMLFFDDENRNIQAVSQMGVKSVLVEDGVNLAALGEGLKKFPPPT